MTVLFVLIIISLGITGFFKVFYNEINNVSKSITNESVDKLPGLNPTDFGFKFAWGIAGEKLLDPSIGSFRVQHVTKLFD